MNAATAFACRTESDDAVPPSVAPGPSTGVGAHGSARVTTDLATAITAAWVREQSVGRATSVRTPFGERRIVYADHVASGRSLQWIEDFITARVLPMYANTHTEDSATGARMTAWAQEAARLVKHCLGAPQAKLLFCGTGCTAAIKRLQEMLGLVVPPSQRERVLAGMAPSERPLVFVGPYEHHSNEVSWRETLAQVIELPLGADGALDLNALRKALRCARPTGRKMYGSFSAASNVTGVITDTRAVARLLHEHGALAFFDFAAAAPHAEVDMRMGEPDGFDAVFISPHKLPGGPGTPGLLLFDPALYHRGAPSTAGGGTVRYVSAQEHHFVDDIEHREDAGTPGTVQRIRAALAFMVQRSMGRGAIARLEEDMVGTAISRLRRHPRLRVLGNLEAPRLAILSFVVLTSEGRQLHPRLVARLLNDLFGIQARAGCACAGPYAHRLLGISPQKARAFRDAVLQGFESVKPGWTRISFAYYLEPEEFDFLLRAIEFIGHHGERFIGEYRLDWHSGAWRHPRDEAAPGLWATAHGLLQGAPPMPLQGEPMGWHECLARARAIAAGMAPCGARGTRPAPPDLAAELVWFEH